MGVWGKKARGLVVMTIRTCIGLLCVVLTLPACGTSAEGATRTGGNFAWFGPVPQRAANPPTEVDTP